MGRVTGAVLANVMFDLAPDSISTTHRATVAHGVSEVVTTLGLVLVIFALVRSGGTVLAPAAVGAYIGAAYWFTSSTSFANRAITIGRMYSDTFADIAPAFMLPFIAAQFLGAALAVLLLRVLYLATAQAHADDAVLPLSTTDASR